LKALPRILLLLALLGGASPVLSASPAAAPAGCAAAGDVEHGGKCSGGHAGPTGDLRPLGSVGPDDDPSKSPRNAAGHGAAPAPRASSYLDPAPREAVGTPATRAAPPVYLVTRRLRI